MDYSERFLAKVSGTEYEHGSSPHTVSEFLRKLGTPLESDWPFQAATFDEFYKTVPAKVYELARAFLQQFAFTHDWVTPVSPEALKQALQFSPLGVSVYAWVQGDDGLYIKPAGAQDNHFVTLYGYEDGKAWHVFDSYDQTHKKLAWSFQFEVAKRYSISRANLQAQLTFWQQVLKIAMQVLNIQAVIDGLKSSQTVKTAPTAPSQPPTTQTPSPAPQPVSEPPKYLWDTPENARHSVRLICDEEGLTLEQKTDMSKTIHCESGYHINAVHPNLYNDTLVSTDRGIAQWNDKYHGSEITDDEAFHDPEKAVRLMCQYVKRGQLKQWVCFSSGLYKQYSA